MNQMITLKAKYDTEITALSHELAKITSKIGSVELIKNREISDYKMVQDNQNQSHVETLKQLQYNQIEGYDNQHNKLRDIIEDKTV